jgi:hypothetical protein
VAPSSGNTKKPKARMSGENKQPKDKFMYKERSYEALIRGNGNPKNVDITAMQSMLTQKKSGMSFLANKINKINFMN